VPWVAALIEPRLIWSPHPRVGLWLGASAYVALQRARFFFEGGPTIHTASIGGIDGRLGLEVYFP
jgi:hypothetical protein